MAVAGLRSASSTDSSEISTPDSFKFETKYIVLSFLNELTKHHNHDVTTGLHASHTSSTDSDKKTRKYFKLWKGKPTFSPYKQYRKSNNIDMRNNKQTSHLSHEHLKKTTSHESFDNKCVSNKSKAVRKYSLPLSDHSQSYHTKLKSASSTPSLLTRSVSDGSSHDHDDLGSYYGDADDELEASQESSVVGSSLGGYGSKSKEHFQRLSTVASESETEQDQHNIFKIGSVAFEMSLGQNSSSCPKSGQCQVLSGNQNSDMLDEIDGRVFIDGDNNTASDFSDSELDLSGELGAKSEGDEDSSTSIGIEVAVLPNGTSGIVDRSCLRLNLAGDATIRKESSELDSVVHSLQEEVQEQMISLESEYEDAIRSERIQRVESPFECPLTPHSKCAHILTVIGDEIDVQYRKRIQDAIGDLFISSSSNFSYDTFRNMANDILDENMPGWRQIAILLMYSQGVAIRLVQGGNHSLTQIVDYSVQLLTDLAANFIIKQGGWGAVMNSDPSRSSTTSQSSPESGYSNNPFLIAMLKQQSTERHVRQQREHECYIHRQTVGDARVSRFKEILPPGVKGDNVQPSHKSTHPDVANCMSPDKHSGDTFDSPPREVTPVDPGSELVHSVESGSSWMSQLLHSCQTIRTTAQFSTTFVLLAASMAFTIAYFKSRTG